MILLLLPVLVVYLLGVETPSYTHCTCSRVLFPSSWFVSARTNEFFWRYRPISIPLEVRKHILIVTFDYMQEAIHIRGALLTDVR